MAFSDKTDVVTNTRCPGYGHSQSSYPMMDGGGTTATDYGAQSDNLSKQGDDALAWDSDEGGAAVLEGNVYLEGTAQGSDLIFANGAIVSRFCLNDFGTTLDRNVLLSTGAVTGADALTGSLLVYAKSYDDDVTPDTLAVVLKTAGGTIEIEHDAGIRGLQPNDGFHTLVIRWGTTTAFEVRLDGAVVGTDAGTDDVRIPAARALRLGKRWVATVENVFTTITGFYLWDTALTDVEIEVYEGDPHTGIRRSSPLVSDFPMMSRLEEAGDSLSGEPDSLTLAMTAEKTASATVQFRVYRATTLADVWSAEPVLSSQSTGTSAYEQLSHTFTGLAAGTEYFFGVEVFTDDSQWLKLRPSSRWGSTEGDLITGSWRVPDTNGMVRFALYADTHVDDEVFDEHVDDDDRVTRLTNAFAAMIDRRPHFVVGLGDDQFMPHQLAGTTINTQDDADEWYYCWRRRMRGLFDHCPAYRVLGNHEGECGYRMNPFGSQYLQRWMTIARKRQTFCVLTNGEDQEDSTWKGEEVGDKVGGAAEGNTSPLGDYFTFRVGPVQIWVLDPYRYTKIGEADFPTSVDEWTLGAEQLSWLETTLAASTAKWKIVAAHQLVGGSEDSPYGRGGIGAALSSGEPGDTETEMDVLHPIFVANGVTLFIRGHDHLFDHGRIGTVFYGEAGTPSKPFALDPDLYEYNGADQWYLAARFGFAYFEATERTLTVQFIETTETEIGGDQITAKDVVLYAHRLGGSRTPVTLAGGSEFGVPPWGAF